MPASSSISAFLGLGLGWMASLSGAAAEPLATAGTDHATAVHVLMALSRGDTEPLLTLPGHLLSDAPALVDPDDPALARRWTALLPSAVARLPVTQRDGVLASLDAHFAQNAGDAAAHPWDFLPAPAAELAVALAAAGAFDRGQTRFALSLQSHGQRADAARHLLQAPLPRPALPSVIATFTPPPTALVHGNGWLFGLDLASRVRWQRHCERQAHVVLGDDAALVVETAGAAVIDGDGHAQALPPLPSFAVPAGITDQVAWFVAGTRAWRVVLSSTWDVTELTLSAPPLGPPVLRGEDAWWLTRNDLILTHGVTVVERLPHLLALSPLARIALHPRGAVIRDGAQTWLVADRDQVSPLIQGNSWLLAGDVVQARRFIDSTPDGSDLAFRCEVSTPSGSISDFVGLAKTPQQRVIAWLAAERMGDHEAESALTKLAQHDPTLLVTEPSTSLALPLNAWPLRTTLAAWKLRNDRQAPDISIHSDAYRVRVRATWPETTRTWERTWPTRPLLDAPSRTWALTDGAVVVADGADHLLLLEQATGNLILSAEVPSDLDPANVVRYGATRAALLCDQGRTVLIIDQHTVTKMTMPTPGRRLRAEAGAVFVVRDGGEVRLP